MIACVTDLDGRITGVHRTWLDPHGFDRVRLGKAPIDTPRRAMGDLLGNAVRFGVVDDVLAAGEGIETMLSLRYALPALPMAAALSANHLAAMMLPSGLRRLYIARDDDAAGDTVQAILTQRAVEAGVEAIPPSTIPNMNPKICACHAMARPGSSGPTSTRSCTSGIRLRRRPDSNSTPATMRSHLTAHSRRPSQQRRVESVRGRCQARHRRRRCCRGCSSRFDWQSKPNVSKPIRLPIESTQTSVSASSKRAIKSAVSSKPADTRMSQRLTPTLSTQSSSS